MKQLVIWDEQREYALRLMRYLNQHSDGLFIALLVQNQEELITILKQGKLVCLLVAKELGAKVQEVAEQLRSQQQETELCWMELTEQPAKETYQIWRYQSGRCIYDQLVHRFFQSTAGDLGQGLQVVGVVALQDTVRVRAYAREQVVSNREIFWEMTLCSDYEGDFYPAEQLLFAIKMREEELKDKLSEYLVCVNQTKIISGLSQFFDGRQLTLEDYQWFFEQLCKAGFEKLYLYLDGSMLNDMGIFSNLNEIWILMEEGCDNRRHHLLGLFELLGIPDERLVVISL